MVHFTATVLLLQKCKGLSASDFLIRRTVTPHCVKAGGVRSATKGGAAVALALLQSRRIDRYRTSF